MRTVTPPQVLLLMFVCGTLAKLGGGPISEGVFIGSFLSMSSTAVVLKCLQDRNWMQYLHGQVIIGTLILQDCIVGLLFALLPVLGGSGSSTDPHHDHLASGVFAILRELTVLGVFLAICFAITRVMLPRALAYVASLSVQSEELYQMMLVAFCLAVAWVSDYFGLSIELGACVCAWLPTPPRIARLTRTLPTLWPNRLLMSGASISPAECHTPLTQESGSVGPVPNRIQPDSLSREAANRPKHHRNAEGTWRTL
jgi:hypothetical protein